MSEYVSINDLKEEIKSVSELKNKSGNKIQLIVFTLAGEEYAVSIDFLKEVVLTPRVARLPHVPSYIKGVTNVRGTLVAIMDLEEKFGLDKIASENKPLKKYTLIIESETYKVGVLCEIIPNTLAVYESEIEDYKDIVRFSTLDEKYFKGIVKHENRLIILVDVHKLIEMETDVTQNLANKL